MRGREGWGIPRGNRTADGLTPAKTAAASAVSSAVFLLFWCENVRNPGGGTIAGNRLILPNDAIQKRRDDIIDIAYLSIHNIWIIAQGLESIFSAGLCWRWSSPAILRLTR
jgi:hypothetical protein